MTDYKIICNNSNFCAMCDLGELDMVRFIVNNAKRKIYLNEGLRFAADTGRGDICKYLVNEGADEVSYILASIIPNKYKLAARMINEDYSKINSRCVTPLVEHGVDIKFFKKNEKYNEIAKKINDRINEVVGVLNGILINDIIRIINSYVSL
jgi:hypothetical protein